MVDLQQCAMPKNVFFSRPLGHRMGEIRERPVESFNAPNAHIVLEMWSGIQLRDW